LAQKRLLAGAAAATVLVGVAAPAAHAVSGEAYEAMTKRYTWQMSATGHAVQYVTYLGGSPNPGSFPVGEVLAGVPYTRIQSSSAPGVVEGFAGLYYPSYIVDDGVLETIGQPGGGGDGGEYYKNPTLVRCSNPKNLGKAQTEESKLEAVEGAGPSAHASCPQPNDVTTRATAGPLSSDATKLGVTTAMSHGDVTEDGKLTLESASTVEDLLVGELSVDFASTRIKLEWPVAAPEPKVSYEIRLSGIHSSGESLLRAGQSLTLSGNDLAVGELSQQFRDQAAEAGKAGKEVASFQLMFMEPQVYPGGERETTVQAPSIGIAVDQGLRKGTVGQYNGIGLGFARVSAHFAQVGSEDGSTTVQAADGQGNGGGGGFSSQSTEKSAVPLGSLVRSAPSADLVDRASAVTVDSPGRPVGAFRLWGSSPAARLMRSVL
jgi:hypothetical protein